MSKRRNNSQRVISSPPVGRQFSVARYGPLLGLGLIAVATCVAYLPAMNGQFIWDDDAHVTAPELRSLHGLERIWFDLGATQQYYPLLHSAFWVEHRLWGDNVLGYHLANLLEHFTAMCLVYLILVKLKVPGALLAAAIFALHPVQVESVAWITEQKNTLSAVFYLSAMLAYLHFDQTRKPAPYLTALGLFILGLLSKTVTATLPAALLVIFWWQRGGLSWRRDVRPLIPFFLLGAVAGCFTAWVERNLIGAEGASFELTILERGLLAGRVMWFYLGKLVWPTNLIFFYPRWDLDTQVWWQWLFSLCAVLVLAALWFLRRRWRAPLAGWLFFVGTLFPVLGFFNVYPFIISFVADHFQYLASLGMIVLAAAGLALTSSQLLQLWQPLASALGVLLVGVLAALTWQQAHMYSDVVMLYQTTIDKNPTCWLAYNNLGVVMARNGDLQSAIEHFQQALKIKPNYHEAHNNLAVELAKTDQTAAIQHLERAIQIKSDYADAHYNLGNSFAAEGRTDEAIDQYQQAIRLKPNYVEAYNNQGTVLKRLGRLPEAIELFRQALELNPNYFEVHFNLADALFKQGHAQEAIEHYQQALQAKSDDVDSWASLALAYAAVHDSTKAIVAGEQALQFAQAQGEVEQAKSIEAWLKYYRSQQAAPQQPAPKSKPAHSALP
jgi:tetratricopeptide (TPR) repeat protein